MCTDVQCCEPAYSRNAAVESLGATWCGCNLAMGICNRTPMPPSTAPSRRSAGCGAPEGHVGGTPLAGMPTGFSVSSVVVMVILLRRGCCGVAVVPASSSPSADPLSRRCRGPVADWSQQGAGALDTVPRDSTRTERRKHGGPAWSHQSEPAGSSAQKQGQDH